MVIISIVVLFFRFLPQMSPDSPFFPATIPAPWQRFFSDAHYFILFFHPHRPSVRLSGQQKG